MAATSRGWRKAPFILIALFCAFLIYGWSLEIVSKVNENHKYKYLTNASLVFKEELKNRDRALMHRVNQCELFVMTGKWSELYELKDKEFKRLVSLKVFCERMDPPSNQRILCAYYTSDKSVIDDKEARITTLYKFSDNVDNVQYVRTADSNC